MKVTQKDRDFLIKILNISNDELEKIFDKVKELPEDGDICKETYVNSLCENKSGRDIYEIKKILLTRLFAE